MDGGVSTVAAEGSCCMRVSSLAPGGSFWSRSRFPGDALDPGSNQTSARPSRPSSSPLQRSSIRGFRLLLLLLLLLLGGRRGCHGDGHIHQRRGSRETRAAAVCSWSSMRGSGCIIPSLGTPVGSAASAGSGVGELLGTAEAEELPKGRPVCSRPHLAERDRMHGALRKQLREVQQLQHCA